MNEEKRILYILGAVALLLIAGILIYNIVSVPPLQTPVMYYEDKPYATEEPAQSSSSAAISTNTTSSASSGASSVTSSANSGASSALSSQSASGSVAPSSAVGSSAVVSDKIDINSATKEELSTLPGIGPAKATAIIEYRESHGAFLSVDDLLSVEGIGEATLENIKPYIVCNN